MFSKKSTRPRRRLTGGVSALVPYIPPAMKIARGVKQIYDAYKKPKISPATARANYRNRLEASDNITTAKAVVIGKQRKISFQEKIARAERPPLMFKRQYGFNVECTSGRKAWFGMEINTYNANDLQFDITSYKSAIATDTLAVDPTLSANNIYDGARFYVDKHNEKIRMVNSSSNSLTGKVHLFACKRDNDNNYSGTFITPINMMMFYSTFGLVTQTNGAGGENVVGRGWAFDTATSGSNYNANYNMPGSSINSAGVSASTDFSLSPFSAHIKDRVGYWFRKVSTSEFSLKPGQQFNSSFIFNDLPEIFREQTDYAHIAGITYHIAVEFQGGIVGDGIVTTGDGVVSTGTCQLSVIRESIRMLGLKNKLKSKIVMQTLPLNVIAPAAQLIINPDSGVSDTGVELDT